MKLAIFFVFITSTAFAQYEYAEATTVKFGTKSKDKVDYYFQNQDSINHYTALKLDHILKAVELLESRGWELLTINSATSSNLIITTAYLRRHARKH